MSELDSSLLRSERLEEEEVVVVVVVVVVVEDVGLLWVSTSS